MQQYVCIVCICMRIMYYVHNIIGIYYHVCIQYVIGAHLLLPNLLLPKKNWGLLLLLA